MPTASGLQPPSPPWGLSGLDVKGIPCFLDELKDGEEVKQSHFRLVRDMFRLREPSVGKETRAVVSLCCTP